MLLGDIWAALELAQKGEGVILPVSIQTQVSNIDSFTKNMESEVRAYIDMLKGKTYVFSQLWQCIESLYNLEHESERRVDEISLGNLKWMGGNTDMGGLKRSGGNRKNTQ